MSKVSLKKYLYELTEHPLDYFLNYTMQEFAFNWNDKTLINSTAVVKQEINTIQDKVKVKVKTWITVLGVSATKNFLERLLRNLPQYERKDPLIIELCFAISHEIKKLDLRSAEGLASLNTTTTSPINLKRIERLYNVNSNYELGIKIRQNIIVAREITRFSTFNFEYLIKICELFQVGEIVDIVNDKAEQNINIVLKENLDMIPTLGDFESFLLEVAPATYGITISN